MRDSGIIWRDFGGIMTTFNQLSEASSLSTSDQLPVYSTANGQPRKASIAALQTLIQDGLTLPSGLFTGARVYGLRSTTSTAQAITTSYSLINNQNQAIAIPSDGDSIYVDTSTGYMTALRDISSALFFATIEADFPTGRYLTSAVIVGPDSDTFDCDFKETSHGASGAPQTLSFSGILLNFDNPFGTIKAGDKIKLSAKINTNDTVTFTRTSLVVIPLDGE